MKIILDKYEKEEIANEITAEIFNDYLIKIEDIENIIDPGQMRYIIFQHLTDFF
jgi:hypothetical protein